MKRVVFMIAFFSVLIEDVSRAKEDSCRVQCPSVISLAHPTRTNMISEITRQTETSSYHRAIWPENNFLTQMLINITCVRSTWYFWNRRERCLLAYCSVRQSDTIFFFSDICFINTILDRSSSPLSPSLSLSLPTSFLLSSLIFFVAVVCRETSSSLSLSRIFFLFRLGITSLHWLIDASG